MSYATLLYHLFGSPEKHVEDWLYGKTDNGTWNKDDQALFDRLYGFEPFKSYFDYKLDMRSRSDYMKNTGLTYGDTNDPRKWPGAGSYGRAYSATMNYVSDNFKRLYR